MRTKGLRCYYYTTTTSLIQEHSKCSKNRKDMTNKKYYSVAVFSRLECDAQGYFEWVTYYIEE